ncbi:MAG: hypothetical protein IPL61_25870 [Myxococcales bacterium]|nr:hypothetical protein [Myxococcales bacterium]
MPTARAIHLGVHHDAPTSYRVRPRALARAEDDARALAAVSTRAGLAVTTLLGVDATRDHLLAAVDRAVTCARAMK